MLGLRLSKWLLKNPSCYEKKSKLLRNGALYNLSSNINIFVDRNAAEMKRGREPNSVQVLSYFRTPVKLTVSVLVSSAYSQT